jgi:putative PIN family toxin of toxin-antitoxin system
MTSPPIVRPNLNIVPDTGFYIAATLKDGYARSYLLAKGSKFLTYQLYSSEAILLELQDKLENKFGFTREQVVSALKDIRRVVNIVHPTKKIPISRDPDDDKIIECAVEAHADLILSFDKDLLVLKEYSNIKMIHPRELMYLFPQH